MHYRPQIDICAIKATPPDQVLMFLLARSSEITHRAHLGPLSRILSRNKWEKTLRWPQEFGYALQDSKGDKWNSHCSFVSIGSLLLRNSSVKVSVQ